MGVAALLAIAPAALPGVAGASAVASASTRSDGVTIPGKGWLQGKGVAVYAGRSCGEVAVRLYAAKRWGQIGSTRSGGAESIPEGSPSLEFYRNGGKYTPVPGDLIVERVIGRQWGHVAIVDKVKKGRIFAVEQNATSSARHTYRWNGRTISGGYGGHVIRGFVHSPKNRFVNQ